MSNARVPEPKIYFTREQFEFLNKMYPEQVGSPTTTEAQFRFNSGARNVVQCVNDRVK
jgi:hypothetical protein